MLSTHGWPPPYDTAPGEFLVEDIGLQYNWEILRSKPPNTITPQIYIAAIYCQLGAACMALLLAQSRWALRQLPRDNAQQANRGK